MTQQEIKAALDRIVKLQGTTFSSTSEADYKYADWAVNNMPIIRQVLEGALWNFDMTAAPKTRVIYGWGPIVKLCEIYWNTDMKQFVEVNPKSGYILGSSAIKAWIARTSLPDMEK